MLNDCVINLTIGVIHLTAVPKKKVAKSSSTQLTTAWLTTEIWAPIVIVSRGLPIPSIAAPCKGRYISYQKFKTIPAIGRIVVLSYKQATPLDNRTMEVVSEAG